MKLIKTICFLTAPERSIIYFRQETAICEEDILRWNPLDGDKHTFTVTTASSRLFSGL